MKRDYVYFQAAKGMSYSNTSSSVPALILNSLNYRAVERNRNQKEVKKNPPKKLSQHGSNLPGFVHAYLSLHIGISRVFKNFICQKNKCHKKFLCKIFISLMFGK